MLFYTSYKIIVSWIHSFLLEVCIFEKSIALTTPITLGVFDSQHDRTSLTKTDYVIKCYA